MAIRIFDVLGRLNIFNRQRSISSLNVIDAATQFNNYYADKKKLAIVLSNPAMLKVIALQCDLFSLGLVKVLDSKDKPIDDDPFLKLINNPNPYQTHQQILWDYMFWDMIGTSHCYVDSAAIEKPDNKIYFLDPSKIEWPQALQNEADKLIFSSKTVKDQQNQTITYRYADNSTYKFPLSRLIINTDLTNGTGNWYKGPSRIDALYKVISNSEEALNAKNINVRYSGKFMVAGTSDPNDTTKLPLGKEEKEDIETKMNGSKQVHAMKSLIEIKRFVENMKVLELNDAFMEDYYTIGLIYGIPRDVLEATASGSTYENQEKARMSHVTYCLQPKGNDLMSAFAKKFGYTERGKKIVIDWSHLPLAQVFEESKTKVQETKIKNLKELIALGVPLKEANKYLGLEFTIEEPKPETTNGNQEGQEESGDQAGTEDQNQTEGAPGNGE